MENVEDFIDQLIDEKGYSDLDDDVRHELKVDMIQRLMDQIDQAAINALPEDKAIELADKLDDESFDDEKVAQFMQDSGIDLQQVALETMLQFRMLYLGEAEAPKAEENTEVAE
jgi:Arc/MetJ-type ribon-helix-helix transcriptional regulator